jgi:hypothetical protein
MKSSAEYLSRASARRPRVVQEPSPGGNSVGKNLLHFDMFSKRDGHLVSIVVEVLGVVTTDACNSWAPPVMFENPAYLTQGDNGRWKAPQRSALSLPLGPSRIASARENQLPSR